MLFIKNQRYFPEFGVLGIRRANTGVLIEKLKRIRMMIGSKFKQEESDSAWLVQCLGKNHG